MTKTIHTLDVTGATLHYEVRGSGPLLLLICGGIYDATGFNGLAEPLADRYAVVTYDRRGNSRSPLADPAERPTIEANADDAYRLLTALGASEARPAYVFGNSSGAVIGLELVARHPELVRTLVAHEPPVFDWLPESKEWSSIFDRIDTILATTGPGEAMEAFQTAYAESTAEHRTIEVPQAEAPQAPQELDAETMAMMGRIQENMPYFIGREVPSFARFAPDLRAVARATTRVVPALGTTSEGEPQYRSTQALADRLAVAAEVFPGDHGGFGQEAPAFAARLAEVIS